MIDEKFRPNTERALKEHLPKTPIIESYAFEWQKDGSLRVKSAIYCKEGRARFTVIFDPLKALTAFTLQFNGSDSHRLAKKYKLRDELDDKLWETLPSTMSLYELSLS